MSTADELRAKWEARQRDPLAARALVPLGELAGEVLADLQALARAAAGEVLSLQEAAAVSGFSVDHLRHLVAKGRLENVGRKGAPRVRRGDLPKKTGRAARATVYDPDQDARALLARSGR